jgi:hypothetical protein
MGSCDGLRPSWGGPEGYAAPPKGRSRVEYLREDRHRGRRWQHWKKALIVVGILVALWMLLVASSIISEAT